MSDFLENEAIRVLEEGFDGPPSSLEPGQTAVFASHVREPYGAVFFIRRWRNGQIDTDCTVTCRNRDGTWMIGAFGGGGWWDPFERPADGWEGDPVVWGGSTGSDLGDDDEPVFVQALEGMASLAVDKLEILDDEGNLFDVVPIRPDTGVFVAIIVGDSTYTVVAKDADGRVVRDAAGQEVRDVFEPRADLLDELHLYGDATESPGIGVVGTDAEGRWFVDSGASGRRVIEDPELAKRFAEKFGKPSPWPRRAPSP